jgi:Peptidase S46
LLSKNFLYNKMKKILLIGAIIISTFICKADEGMWLPFLISQNYNAMARAGFKLTAQDLYDINKGSMKDAIVHFGGFCTGEVVSKEGLVLTNHHCGYDAIASLSTADKNFLANGFAAIRREDEMPCPGLFVKFLVRVDDVTDMVNKATKKTTGEAFDKKLEAFVEKMSKQEKDKGYEIDIKSFFAGNKYYMMVYERYTDIRLTAAPPENLGKFGGDTDNWMWPRHTCDFSMFRIYANTENKPAAYSKNNRPYQPKHSLPVSFKGVKEGDYSMIYGYPGRTQRYLTSYGVDIAVNVNNPAIVKIRDKKLAIMREEMNKDVTTELKYASGYASIANYWKYYIGQTEQLKAQHVLQTKQTQENDFVKWADGKKAYNNIFKNYETAYENYKPYSKPSTYFREALLTANITKLAMSFANLEEAYGKKNIDSAEVAKAINRIKSSRKNMMKNMDLITDKKLFSAMNLMYYQDVPMAQQASIFSNEIFKKYGNDDWQKTFNDYTEYIYSNSALFNDAKFDTMMANINKDNYTNDVAVNYAMSLTKNFKETLEPKQKEFLLAMTDLNKSYQAGLLAKNAGQLMYPDANSTMRLSYGNVKAYRPKDAVSFNYYTTAEGLLEKYKAGDKEFDLQDNIVTLLKNKDYGDYADNTLGTLTTCFITNNDITGGNSGSPVINGKGELIGLAFDGNWEAMSGDIAFDQKYKRTICADIRYVCWVLDKVLGGNRIVNEMTIVK